MNFINVECIFTIVTFAMNFQMLRIHNLNQQKRELEVFGS